MYKDLVVSITETPGDIAALGIAIDFAAQHGAHLTVLRMVSLPAPVLSPWGMTPDVALVELYKQLREDVLASVVALRSQLEKEPISSQVDTIETVGALARSAAHRAHYADLTVVAGSIGNTVEAEITSACNRDRYFAVGDHLAGHRAKQEARESAAAPRAHDDHVVLAFLREPNDRL